MRFPERPTIYLDVSGLVGNRRNTGIQRVVRDLAAVAPSVCEQFLYNCRLVHCIDGQFYRLRYDLIDPTSNSFVSKVARRGIGRQVLQKAIPRFTSPLRPLAMDRMITLGGNWDQSSWLDGLQEIRKQCHVSSVVHDLIPLTHPQFHTAELKSRFSSWFTKLTQTAHNLVATSKVGRETLQDWVDQHCQNSSIPRVSQFRLTSQLTQQPTLRLHAPSIDSQTESKAADTSSVVRTELSQFLSTDQTTLLAVGTIEPRKNHQQLLNACQKLWNSGWNGRLLIVGAVGWNCEEIQQQISDLSGQQLYHLSDASDIELSYAYQNCRAMVFGSWHEGFGLPIVEALASGLPTLLSDTPIHREVGGTSADYFALGDPTALVSLIQHHEQDQFQSLRRLTDDFVSIDCFRSFHSLLCDSIVAGRGFRALVENTPPWLKQSEDGASDRDSQKNQAA